MGLCVSSACAASEARAEPTKATSALVLLPTGELREYPRPATAASVLADVTHDDGWFLCDSDRMGLEGPVAAVGGADELRAGRLYFVFPTDVRRRSLRREEVAALAVKASAALAARASSATSAGRRRRGGAAVAPLVFSLSPTEEEDEGEAVEVAHKAPKGTKRRPAARARWLRRRFAPDLTAIPECGTNE